MSILLRISMLWAPERRGKSECRVINIMIITFKVTVIVEFAYDRHIYIDCHHDYLLSLCLILY